MPIEIHLKNRDEPKKIKVNYDLELQPSGPPIKKVRNEQHVFPNPSDEFRRKLLKAGGTILNIANSVHSNVEHERNSRDSITEEKSQQLIGKPKLGGDNIKKHKPKDYDLSRQPNNLKNLFGPNIHKLPTISPDPKKPSPTSKAEKREKLYIEKDKQKPKEIEHREEKKVPKDEKTKEDKRKSHKDRDLSKDKSSKRLVEKAPSPIPPVKRPVAVHPVHPHSPRRVSSPSNKSNSSASSKEEVKSVKQINSAEPKIKQQKMPDISLSKIEKKIKKDKKSHDKEREMMKKEHKKDKDPKPVIPEIRENKPKEILKETVTKDISTKEKEKPPTKPEKPINKFSIENMLKDPQDALKYSDSLKHKGKSDREKKHKHKKKDKKRDESREKIKDQFPKEKKHKSDKKLLSDNKETINIEKLEPVSVAKDPEKTISISKPFKEKDRSILTISPISIDTSSQSSSKSLSKSSKSGKNPLTSMMEALSSSSCSDSDNSIISDDEDTQIESIKILKITSKLPEPNKSEPVKLPPEVAKMEKQPIEKIEKNNQFSNHRAQKMKEKTTKQEMKEEKKQRKRKSGSKGEDETTSKMSKLGDEVDQVTKKRSDNASNPLESFLRTKSESSRSKTDTKVQDDGVSSSLSDNPLKCDSPINEDSHMTESHEISPDYMIQLKELQKRIMTIQNNEELERVVNLIAETGKYEVTKKTFDFDLCLLDRTTVQQLQEMIGCESRA